MRLDHPAAETVPEHSRKRQRTSRAGTAPPPEGEAPAELSERILESDLRRPQRDPDLRSIPKLPHVPPSSNEIR